MPPPRRENESDGDTTYPPGALRSSINDSIRRYFRDLGDEEIFGVYRMVLDEVELPLLSAVMEHARGNHSRAARILGLHRNTLCKKLRRHGLLR